MDKRGDFEAEFLEKLDLGPRYHCVGDGRARTFSKQPDEKCDLCLLAVPVCLEHLPERPEILHQASARERKKGNLKVQAPQRFGD